MRRVPLEDLEAIRGVLKEGELPAGRPEAWVLNHKGQRWPATSTERSVSVCETLSYAKLQRKLTELCCRT
jgi:hypothetical protein